MFANSTAIGAQSGTLNKDVHLPASSLHELLDFVADELPRWRNRPDRKLETAETILTSQLCAHLNSAAHHSTGWDILQFRVEEADEKMRGRKVDLVAAPCGVAIWIDGRGYTDFDPLLPIECKRLPTPNEKGRDEREYTFSRTSTTGGIQRFKAGHHGAAHSLGAMVAYVQEETTIFWSKRVAGWINDLTASGEPGWTQADLLQLEREDKTLRIAIFRSSHDRNNSRRKIELRHFWVEMN